MKIDNKVNRCCIEAVKGLVDHLYIKFRNTEEVVEASQYLDKLLNEYMEIQKGSDYMSESIKYNAEKIAEISKKIASDMNIDNGFG